MMLLLLEFRKLWAYCEIGLRKDMLFSSFAFCVVPACIFGFIWGFGFGNKEINEAMKRWPCVEEITYKGKTDSFFFNHVSCLVMSDTTQPFCGLGKHQQTPKLSKIMCDFESVRNNCHESFEWFFSIPWTTVTKRSTQHGSTCVRRHRGGSKHGMVVPSQ